MFGHNKAYHQIAFSLPSHFTLLIEEEKWDELDREIQTILNPEGSLYQEIEKFIAIKKTEFILSLRQNPDEDGIWHDDGSRELAFTLSLTQEQIIGGDLELRHKEDKIIYTIPTPPYGTLTLFLTGVHHYEHRVLKVIKGKRLICAGWIN